MISMSIFKFSMSASSRNSCMSAYTN